ncbi:MAG TPA: response regulator [Legionella sp.]|nr:response regulator [Legionella sp.]
MTKKINKTKGMLKKQLQELEEELSFYHDIMNYIPGHVYWLDKKNRYLGCNLEHAKNIGLENRLDIVGKTNKDMPWKDSAATVDHTNQEVMKTGNPVTIKETGVINGIESTFLSQKVPLKNKHNDVVGILGISIDITEIEQLQKSLIDAKKAAEAASQAKTEFLEHMRHDIRTPLTGIVGFSELLMAEANNPYIKEYSENLVASSHALLKLLDEVLEAIRISSGDIPKLKKKFNLERTLTHIINLNRAKAAQKKIALSLQFDKKLPEHVIGDKMRLHRVALELIANALKFTDAGFVTLTAILAKHNQRQLVLKLIVEDSGIGIPKDKQQEIYVQFKRLTPSYQGIYKGTGLGLSVVKQFIDELDGEIYVESEAAKGSRFTCLIPLQEPLLNDDLGLSEEQESSLNSSFDSTLKEITSGRQNLASSQLEVLVVEDNLIAQTVAKSIIIKLGCIVDIAETGKAAVDLAKTKHYDLIFLDIGLPDIDGYQVAQLIRVNELTLKTHCPIIALTAHAGEGNKKRCTEAGMDAVLTKPLTFNNCMKIMNTYLPIAENHLNQYQSGCPDADLPLHNEEMFDILSFPILDPDEGIKTTGTLTVLAEMLRFMIYESLPKDLALMKEAYSQFDWDKTQQLAHKIKGGAVYVGTVRIKMACQYLERYWKSGQRDLLEPLYLQNVFVIEESIEYISNWLIQQTEAS